MNTFINGMSFSLVKRAKKELELDEHNCVECAHCQTKFVPTSTQKWKWKQGMLTNLFCSRSCRAHHSRRRITQCCKICGDEVTRALSEVKKSKSGNIFCSLGCASVWSNYTSKKFNAVSLLEKQIVESLKKDFPDIEIELNSNTQIGSELDIYFPSLALAIEINGPYHYFPLRNNLKKLIATIKNDVRKRQAAELAGIKLYVLNSSKLRGKKAYSTYYPQIHRLITSCLESHRAADLGKQP